MPSGSRTEKMEATKELSTALEQSHITETRFILETDHLSRVISGKRLVDDITIGTQKGEVLAVVEPSGSGKSSFLRLLNRLDESTSGTVYLEGTAIQVMLWLKRAAKTSDYSVCCRLTLARQRYLDTTTDSRVVGRVKKKVAPLPGSDSTQMRPPDCSIIRLQIARPIPVPGYSLRVWSS